MAGTLINTYSQLDSDILAVQLTLDKTRKSLHAVSLTNYDNTSEPQIAAGSVIEVNGGFYEFEANETITGSPSDGTVYIMIVPSGTTCTAQYTNTAPTWSDSKQGYYGTGGSANYRYLEYTMDKVSTEYYNKYIFTDLFIKKKFLYFSLPAGSNQGNATHYIPNAMTNSRIISIRDTSGTTSTGYYSLYSISESADAWVISFFWNDSVLTLTRSNTVSARIFRVLVEYI